MPKYDFKCKDCKHEFEELTTPQKIDEIKCLKCGSKNTEKLLSAPAIILKGKGFYKTDSRIKSGSSKKSKKSSSCGGSSCSSCSACS